MNFITLRARLAVRLIDDWRSAHRYLSIKLSALGAMLMALAGFAQTELPGLWSALPADLREHLPAWCATALFVAVAVARYVKQPRRDG